MKHKGLNRGSALRGISTIARATQIRNDDRLNRGSALRGISTVAARSAPPWGAGLNRGSALRGISTGRSVLEDGVVSGSE